MKCTRCSETPGFHSFEQLADISGLHYFYCFPAHNKQSVRTREDMLNFVSHFPTDRRWSLVFHANGYGIQHLMPFSVALEMGALVQDNYTTTLQKIYVVEGHWLFQFLLKCILPCLKSEMRDKFVLVNGSLLEVTAKLRDVGLTLKQLEPLRSHFG
jgi:hypothetical protein